MPKVIPPFDYKNLTGKDPASTTLVKAFVQHKADVASIEGEGKIKRMSGVAYKELALAMADSQHVILRIKDTGDVFQVLVNNKVVPIKNQDNIAKAVIEIVDRLDSGRAAFQKAMLRKKVEAPVPKGIKTAALNMIPTLQERIPALKAEIEAVREERVAIEAERAKAGENQNPIKSESAVVAPSVAENVPVAALESNKLRAWQEPARAGEDPAGGAAVIEAWDSAKADSLFVQETAGEKPHSDAAEAFISRHMQGRIVKTAVGDCAITSRSSSKLSQGVNRANGVKFRCIPRVPEVLTQGRVDPAMLQLDTERSDGIDGFYLFEHAVAWPDMKADVRIKVGHRASGTPPLVYDMTAKKADSAMDSAQKEGSASPSTSSPDDGAVCLGYGRAFSKDATIIRYPTEQVGTHSVSRNALDVNLAHALDAVNTDDGLNIEILHVWDKDGNELDPETLDLLGSSAAGGRRMDELLDSQKRRLVELEDTFSRVLSDAPWTKNYGGSPYVENSKGRAMRRAHESADDRLRGIDAKIKDQKEKIANTERRIADNNLKRTNPEAFQTKKSVKFIDKNPVSPILLRLEAQGKVKRWIKNPEFFFVVGMEKIALMTSGEKVGVSRRFPAKTQDELDFARSMIETARIEIEAENQIPSNRQDDDLVDVSESNKAEPAPIEITGNELGKFADDEEGKNALREAATQFYAKELIKSDGVFCSSLSVQVMFDDNGMEKLKSFSGDRRKLKMVPFIKAFIAKGERTFTMEPSAKARKRGITKAHVIKHGMVIDGKDEVARLIIHERKDGVFSYDHAVDNEEKRKATGGSSGAMDAVDATDQSLPVLQQDEPSSWRDLSLILDRADSAVNGMVLNLFIEGEGQEHAEQDTGNEPGESAQDEPAQPLAQPENPIIQSMRALLAVPDDALLAQAKAALDDDAALFDDAPDALRHAAHVTATSIQSELAP